MSLTLLQLYGAGSGGTEDAIASIDIPEDGELVGIDWAVDATFDAIGEAYVGEVSFIATNTFSTNDARGMMSQIRMRAAGVTSGMLAGQANKFVAFDSLEVSGGERLYLHVNGSAGLVSATSAIVHLVTRRDTVRRSRRRR